MTRTIHLIRHGQSTFNALHDLTGLDPMINDAPLSPLGHEQVAAARVAYADVDYDVIFTSPLTRAIQTATGIFGSKAPMLVNYSHSEWVTHSCSTGRPASQLAREFAHLDFNHMAEVWWHRSGPVNQHGIACEPLESLLQRVSDFRAMIAARPERRVAVVGHGDFFHQVTGHFMNNCERVEMHLR